MALLKTRVTWAIAAAFVCAVMGASAAQANPVSIWFDQDDGKAKSMDFWADGVKVTATAAGRWVHQNDEGLGVYGGGGDSYDLDGWAYNEVLKLTFSEKVQILSIDFEQVDDNDQTTLKVNGTQIASGYIEKALGMSGASANCNVRYDSDECQVRLHLADVAVKGTMFEFGALGDYSDFRIEHIKFERMGGGSTVPEPSAALLFGAGALITHAGIRRRRN